MNYIAKVTRGFSGADLTEICQRVSNSIYIEQLRYHRCNYRSLLLIKNNSKGLIGKL